MLALTLGAAAMIKDIIVNISIHERSEPTLYYAVSLASAFEAHVTGIAFAYDSPIPISALGYIRAQIIDEQSNNQAAAKAVIDKFKAATARTGVSADQRMLSANMDNAGERFARIARLFDLAIVSQATPNKGAVEAMISESTLFGSGRPVLVVPYIQKAPLKLDRVMVCWDGSWPAARAVADAMPFLEQAKQVEVVIVTNERGKNNELEGVDMGQHLARHRVNVEVHRIPRADIDVADALLSYATDSGADFMVMGGYGHSRMREFVLGGVTRSIFRSTAVPTLMSH
jgi:nucleotide-binding universal stress UspA family protein